MTDCINLMNTTVIGPAMDDFDNLFDCGEAMMMPLASSSSPALLLTTPILLSALAAPVKSNRSSSPHMRKRTFSDTDSSSSSSSDEGGDDDSDCESLFAPRKKNMSERSLLMMRNGKCELIKEDGCPSSSSAGAKSKESSNVVFCNWSNVAPSEPPALADTNILVADKSIDEIYKILESYLSKCSDLVFSRTYFSYSIACTNSDYKSRMRVNIYSSKSAAQMDSNVFVIEAIYESGDRYMFFDIFSEIKQLLRNDSQKNVLDLTANALKILGPPSVVIPSETDEKLTDTESLPSPPSEPSEEALLVA